METAPDLHSYERQYMAAKNELSSGHKDKGLRILFTLRHHLSQAPTVDGELWPFRNLLDETLARCGEGFDWD